MDAAINCLERELAMLANNFAVTADAIAKGDQPDDMNQDNRWNQIESIRRGIASLRHANTGQAQFGQAARNQDANNPAVYANMANHANMTGNRA